MASAAQLIGRTLIDEPARAMRTWPHRSRVGSVRKACRSDPQSRQRAVGEQPTPSLTARAVVAFVVGVGNALYRGAAHRARLLETTVHGHLGTKSGDLLGKTVLRILPQAIDPDKQRRARGIVQPRRLLV